MNVKFPIGFRLAVNQTTRAKFIIGVILNNLSMEYRFSYFLHTYAPDDALINGMLRKLELLNGELLYYFVNERHVRLTTCQTICFLVFNLAA